MAGGSLKSALARKADIVAGPLTRVVLALDTAKGVDYLHSKAREAGRRTLAAVQGGGRSAHKTSLAPLLAHFGTWRCSPPPATPPSAALPDACSPWCIST